ncbi:hypothetical protein DVH24_030949 [Malus domestica]|uniref:Uncharacterized protein n=1 Tax=Malus domestica TaxID=3750 RepID=A0A498HAZ0_MALDO|nr:hypothetical protein DVH24_030949 [Malus domestica]
MKPNHLVRFGFHRNSEVKRVTCKSNPMMGDPLGSSHVSFQKQNYEGVVRAQSGQYRATVVERASDVDPLPWACGMLQSTPLRCPTSSSAHFRPMIDSDTKLSHPDSGPHHILGSTPPNSHENFPVGHPSWECFRANFLNFEVPMESKASELLKGLVLGRDENIHIRLT